MFDVVFTFNIPTKAKSACVFTLPELFDWSPMYLISECVVREVDRLVIKLSSQIDWKIFVWPVMDVFVSAVVWIMFQGLMHCSIDVTT